MMVQRVLLLCLTNASLPCLAPCPAAAGMSAVEAFGAELDIEDTGFVQVNKGQVSTLLLGSLHL